MDTDAVVRRGWSLSLYRMSGEAGGAWVSGEASVQLYVPAGEAEDPERAADEAARRAQGKIRRYCTANGLNRLGTLTYAGDGNHDPLLLREHMGEFFRSLRASLGGNAFPYAWVPEWHKSGHGLHVHFAIGQYVKPSVIDAAWGHGFQPEVVKLHAPLLGDALDQAAEVMGARPSYVWESGQMQGWDGPPAVWTSWD